MEKIEFSEEKVNNLAHELKYFMEEKNDAQESFKFVNKFTIATIIFMFVSLGITFNHETFAIGILSLLSSTACTTWGIKSSFNLKNTIKKFDVAIRETLKEKHDYVTEYLLSVAHEKKEEVEKDVQRKIQEENLRKMIYNVSFINPSLFFEWLIFASKMAKNYLKTLNVIIDDFAKINNGDFNIKDEYFVLDDIIYSISGVLIRFSTRGKEYQNYLESKNIKIYPFSEKRMTEDNTYDGINISYVKSEFVRDFINFCKTIKDNVFYESLILNLERAYNGDFENILDMCIYFNNTLYSIIDLVIYFSPNGDEVKNYWQNKEAIRLNRIYPKRSNLTK